MTYEWIGANIIPLSITYWLAFAALLVGSITDFKTREVPDWVNYGLIISGFGINALFTFIYGQFETKALENGNILYVISPDSYLISSFVGLIIFFCIAYVMFYAGQWGGGDSKMLMGLGATVGFGFKSNEFMLGFLINALLAGALYGMLWSIMLALKDKKKFLKEFKKGLYSENAVKLKKRLLLITAIPILLVLLFIFLEKRIFDSNIAILFLLIVLILVTFYLWVFVKAIEKSSMYKMVEPAKLTEGDWIVNDVHVGRQYICGPKDLGISKQQIRKLIEFYKKGKVKKILIKEGIPFVPSFLIAFVATLFFGNVLMWIL